MIYPESIEEKLGFDVIRKRLSGYCRSDLGKELVEKVSFKNNLAGVRTALIQVDDFARLLAEADLPEIGAFSDISEYIKKGSVQGNWLAANELYKVLVNISSAVSLANFTIDTEYPSLARLAPEFDGLSVIAKQLQRSVNKEGEVLSSAGKELKTIRQQIINEEGNLRKVVSKIFMKAKEDGFIPDGASIGVRDGRMVIPIKASNKRQVKGFIHDESATGNIVFLEPTTILDSNNTIRELQIAENREIRKILVSLTAEVNLYTVELKQANKFLAEIDLLWAKAKLAKALEATLPEITDTQLNLKELRHPLLISIDKRQPRKVIPHDLYLNRENRILLISGPNAGGKSVALKSLGLNQMMLQSGILPCCHADSQFILFDDMLIDIGDEQSIDNDLSTYSSHLQNMSVMLKQANKKSLILIDEFGSGTDPAFGGAIAEAVLRELNTKQCFGIITTHFSNLKIFAEKTSGISNAAMLFDLDELKPLYQLETGRPGSSFSLEVAAQSGLPEGVISEAQKSAGIKQVDIERLLAKLENEQRKLDQQNTVLTNKDKELTLLKDEYLNLKNTLEGQKKEIVARAKEQAADILAKTNKEIEKTIRHIKENKAEKKETKKIRHNLKKFASHVVDEKKSMAAPTPKLISGNLKAGDMAMLDTGVLAEILAVKGKKAKLLIGELQSIVALSRLQKVSRREAKEFNQRPQYGGTIAKSVNSKMLNFSPVLDVRGKRANEILAVLQQFLDQAVMLNQQSLKIIHGKGNGVLRQLIRQELRQWPQVIEFANEHADRGGDGITIVQIK